jgi:hypothetical protein
MKYLDNIILVNGHAGGMICLPLYIRQGQQLLPQKSRVLKQGM